jgi:RimJ/RimL family protein N-acetyltransferase
MEELIFNKITENDLQFLNDVRNGYCEEFLHNSNKFSLEETIKWFKETNPNYWVIYLNNDRIGYFRLSNYSKENKNIYIGADIHKNFTNSGLGYKSYKKFIPFLFKKMDLHKISLEVLSTNERAIHLYKKIGFITDGIKRDEIFKNGVWIDSIIMSILSDEYHN